MLLFTVTQPLFRNRVYIPYQVRAGLGIHDGVSLAISQPEAGTRHHLSNQIVASATPHELQADLWELTAVFHDQAGIVGRLLNLISTENVDILECRCATRNQLAELVVHLTLDAAHYRSKLDRNSAYRQRHQRTWPKELYSRIVATFIKEIAFRPDGQPNLYLKRNHVLADSVAGTEIRFERPVRNGWFEIPTQILEVTRASFELQYGKLPSGKSAAGRPLASLVGDTGFKALLVTIYLPNTGHVHARVSLRDDVGSLARLGSQLHLGRLNILQAYSRPTRKGLLLADYLLQLPSEVDDFRNDSRLQSYVVGLVTDRSLRDLRTKVSFPNPISREQIQRDKGRGV